MITKVYPSMILAITDPALCMVINWPLDFPYQKIVTLSILPATVKILNG